METFGFFQFPFLRPSETASMSSQSDSPTAPIKPSRPRHEHPKPEAPLTDDIAEMVQNPVFWMMP